MKKLPTDKEAWDAAEEISQTANRGEDIAIDAMKQASIGMTKLIENVKTKGGKIEALRAHAIELGIGAQLLNQALPIAKGMKNELIQAGTSDNEAKVLSEIWLAKVVRELARSLNES